MCKKQANKKAYEKLLYNWPVVLKDIELPNQLGTKRKGIASQPTSEETTYFTFSEIESLQCLTFY